MNVRGSWHWRRVGKAFRLARALPGDQGEEDFGSFPQLVGALAAQVLALAPAYRLVIEGQYPDRKRGLLALSRSAGILEGVLGQHAVGPVGHPLWSQWTRESLRAVGGGRRVAAYARERAAQVFVGVPHWFLDVEHYVDALWLAHWTPLPRLPRRQR